MITSQLKSATHRPNSLILMAVWLMISCGYFLYRISIPTLIRDDSSRIYVLRTVPPLSLSQELEVAFGHYETRYNSTDLISGGITLPPFEWFMGGYRPISTLYSLIFSVAIINGYGELALPVALTAIFMATAALAMYFVTRRFVASVPIACLAVFLFLTSTPVITAAWVNFSGVQIWLPMLLCLALLAYWSFYEKQRYQYFYAAGLILIMLIGPWVREFMVILPVLIIGLEIQRRRQRKKRSTIILTAASLMVIHGLFPMVLPKLFFPNLAVRPIFQIGILGLSTNVDQTTGNIFAQLLTRIIRFIVTANWYSIPNLLALLPNTLWLITLIASIIILNQSIKQIRSRKTSRNTPGAVYNLTLLIVWFLLAFTPTLVIPVLQAHLAYALLPLYILMSRIIELLAVELFRDRNRFAILRYMFILAMIIVVGDQALNLYSAHAVANDISVGILEVADWLTDNTPKGTIVLTNALHGMDITYYTHYHVQPVWLTFSNMPDAATMSLDTEAFKSIVRVTNQPVYVLEAVFRDQDGNIASPKLPLLTDDRIKLLDLGVIHITKTDYPFIDPLDILTPHQYIPFLGGPDLRNDFYHGNSPDKIPFLRENYVEYHLYKMKLIQTF